ncbi:hypothetical protein FACS189434_14140 [Bacteroidia bacterium]|nr:hypothetical protein FACS189434_14140 [Bacteroidia bacterium]
MKRLVLTLMASALLASISTAQEQTVIIYSGETSDVPVWVNIGSAADISNTWSNPAPNSLNSTAHCVSVWRNPADDAWTGGGLAVDINPTCFNSFSLMVLKESQGNVQLEVQDESGSEVKKAYLLAWYSGDNLGEWQELTFTLPQNHELTTITSILVAPQIDTNDAPNFVGHRMYWDQLIVKGTGCKKNADANRSICASYNRNTPRVEVSANDAADYIESVTAYTTVNGNNEYFVTTNIENAGGKKQASIIFNSTDFSQSGITLTGKPVTVEVITNKYKLIKKLW